MIAGVVVIGLLSLLLPGDDRLRRALPILTLALGGALAIELVASKREARAYHASLHSNRFVVVEAELDRDWQKTTRGTRLRVRRFLSRGDGPGLSIDEPLTIYAPTGPEPMGDHATIRARGFLRLSRYDRFYLSVKSWRLIEYQDETVGWNPRSLNRRLDRNLAELLELSPESSRAIHLARALVLGRSDDLPLEVSESYRRGGTYHLLVFSGMQIAFAAALLTLLVRKVGAGRLADWLLLIFAAVAPLFAGFDSSVSRSATMIGLYALSRVLFRPTPIENLFFVSALVRLLFVPGDLVDPGFALTWAATGGLIFIGRPLARRARSTFAKTVLFGVGAELATQPLTLHFFQHYVLGGALVTAVVGPVMAAMMLLSALVCLLAAVGSPVVFFGLEIVALLDRLVVLANESITSTPWLEGVALGAPVMVIVGSFLVASLGSSGTRPRPAFCALVLLVPALVAAMGAVTLKPVVSQKVDVLDVGQGDAILVRQDFDVVLIDGGGREGDLEWGRRNLIPILLGKGVRRINGVVLTHPDADHCGGLLSVVRFLVVDELWISPRHLRSACGGDLARAQVDLGRGIRFVRDGDQVRAGVLAFEVIQGRLRYKKSPVNNSSLVLAASLGGRRFLFTGDIEKDAEGTLTNEESHRLRADVLKVPHHGSASSSTERFLAAVDPRVAVTSCGRDNPFGHPAEIVANRIRKRGVRHYRTDKLGGITVVVRDGHLFVSTDPGRRDEEVWD